MKTEGSGNGHKKKKKKLESGFDAYFGTLVSVGISNSNPNIEIWVDYLKYFFNSGPNLDQLKVVTGSWLLMIQIWFNIKE